MSKQRKRLSDQIRAAVDASGLSRYAICKATGIHQPAMSRFMARKSGLTLANIDAMADLLKLELKPGRRGRRT